MKILLAPDSFKGALSAADAAGAMARGLRRVWPDAHCVLLPLADGGEGTLDTLLAASPGSQRIVETVTGPLGEPVRAAWGILPDGKTAVVELAQAAGLTLVPADQRDPMRATTRGVGELIVHAAARPRIRRLLVTLGGSATNDGGAGILQAMGVDLRDAGGLPLAPGGAALANLALRSATPQGVSAMFDSVEIACDVDNPLTGPRGASAVFGPQKGVSPADAARLDAALTHYAHTLGIDPTQPGLGAAGGAPAGLLHLFPHATLRPGIEIVLDAIGFDTHLADADLVLTGEGRFDSQTLGGKAIAGVARRARVAGVPVGAIVGSMEESIHAGNLADVMGISAVLALAPGPCSLAESMNKTEAWLEAATERTARWMLLGRSTAPVPSASPHAAFPRRADLPEVP